MTHLNRMSLGVLIAQDLAADTWSPANDATCRYIDTGGHIPANQMLLSKNAKVDLAGISQYLKR